MESHRSKIICTAQTGIDGYFKKRRDKLGWVGKGGDLRRVRGRVNMIKIYCVKSSKN